MYPTSSNRSYSPVTGSPDVGNVSGIDANFESSIMGLALRLTIKLVDGLRASVDRHIHSAGAALACHRDCHRNIAPCGDPCRDRRVNLVQPNESRREAGKKDRG